MGLALLLRNPLLLLFYIQLGAFFSAVAAIFAVLRSILANEPRTIDTGFYQSLATKNRLKLVTLSDGCYYGATSIPSSTLHPTPF
jgi:hypothetical protein